MYRKTMAPALLLLLAWSLPAHAQAAADSSAVVATALDYIEGWYTGDADRMTRAVHPQLAKRIVHTRDDESMLQDMGAEQLIDGTRQGYGTQTPETERRKEVTILDMYENAASVKVMARDWVDYLHLAQWNGDWKIVNVLWELTPEARQRMMAQQR